MYNENEINPELEEQLDNVFNRYIKDEEEYKELCVEFIDRTLLEEPEARELFNTFLSLGVTEVKAKSKMLEYLLGAM